MQFCRTRKMDYASRRSYLSIGLLSMGLISIAITGIVIFHQTKYSLFLYYRGEFTSDKNNIVRRFAEEKTKAVRICAVRQYTSIGKVLTGRENYFDFTLGDNESAIVFERDRGVIYVLLHHMFPIVDGNYCLEARNAELEFTGRAHSEFMRLIVRSPGQGS